MEIEVLTHTEYPELICACSMKSTKTKESAYKLLQNDWRRECQFATVRLAKQFCDDCDYKKYCVPRLLIRAKQLKHWGVFEHATFTVSVSGVSRSLTHQLVRHRIASYLQQSLRAVKIDTDSIWFVVPETIENKCPDLFADFMTISADFYDKLLSEYKIPVEDARFVLPIGTKTNIVITMNARSWLHFFKLRLDKHAQWEIREMAQKILNEFMDIAPLIFEGAGELEA